MFYYIYPTADQWRWTLFAGKDRKIAVSGEGYLTKKDAFQAVNLVRGDNRTPIKEKPTVQKGGALREAFVTMI